MKNNYRKLKFSILLQTVLVTALTVLVGGFLLNYVIDGVYNDSFANAFVKIMMAFGVNEQAAIQMYWRILGDNKEFFMIVGFLLLFALFFYVALSKMTRYLDQVGDGIENIVSDSTEPIRLITELKPIEIRLNEIKATLKRQELESIEGEKKKNDLVVFLAHDLKTPLTSIVAYLSMLDSHPEMDQEEREKYTQIALEKSMRLGELINEFFDITRFNFSHMILKKSSVNLTIMLQQILSEFMTEFKKKGLEITCKAEPDCWLLCDAEKLERVFDNILKNLINYSYPNTQIRISLRRLRENKLEMITENRGKTIPKEMQEHIFEQFFRLDSSRASQSGGAGIGLAVAKEIVTLHGGEISCKSKDEIIWFKMILPACQRSLS